LAKSGKLIGDGIYVLEGRSVSLRKGSSMSGGIDDVINYMGSASAKVDLSSVKFSLGLVTSFSHHNSIQVTVLRT
jgi:hypothetical protein